ncbi:MAG: mechanosensitive ion channel protein, partial [Planctomycetota bacterium]
MDGTIHEQPWFAWAIALVLVFPALVVVLGEVIASLRRNKHPLVNPLRLIRNWVVPSLIARLFFVHVLELPVEHLAVRVVST